MKGLDDAPFDHQEALEQAELRRRAEAERDKFATAIGEIVRLLADDIASIEIRVLLRDLPGLLVDIRDERDRLRAVVEADRRFLAHDGPVEGDEARQLWEAYADAHRALDGYEVEAFDAGDGT